MIHDFKPSDFQNYSRIILVGSAGSGKSWLSKRIAEITGYPLTHLDNEFWQPGWVKLPKEEWLRRQEALLHEDRWIIDGTYTGTLELRFAAADLIIYLDINPLVCLGSAMRRTGKKRSDLPAYLDEPTPLTKDFLDFCKMIWLFRKNDGKQIMDLNRKYPDKAFLHVRSRRETRRLLAMQQR